MADKKTKDEGLLTVDDEIASIVKRPSSITKTPPAKKYYDSVSWKGVKEVFRCEACGTCRDDEDSMIEHVLIHVPFAEQERVFDQLIKEKK